MSMTFERHGGTALLTPNSPVTRNAFTAEIRDGLADGIAQTRASADIRTRRHRQRRRVLRRR